MRKALRVDGTTAAIDAAVANIALMHTSLPGFTGTGYEDAWTARGEVLRTP